MYAKIRLAGGGFESAQCQPDASQPPHFMALRIIAIRHPQEQGGRKQLQPGKLVPGKAQEPLRRENLLMGTVGGVVGGKHDEYRSALAQVRSDVFEYRAGVGDVLDHIAHDDQIEGSVGEGRTGGIPDIPAVHRDIDAIERIELAGDRHQPFIDLERRYRRTGAVEGRTAAAITAPHFQNASVPEFDTPAQEHGHEKTPHELTLVLAVVGLPRPAIDLFLYPWSHNQYYSGMQKTILVIIASLLLAGTVQFTGAAEEHDRETVGVRLGYAATTSGLDDSFGAGMIAAVHFIEKINSSAGVDFNFGSIYLGRTSRSDITFDRFMTNDEMRMNVIFMTVAPTFELRMHRDYYFFTSAGAGVYAVSLVRELGYLWGTNTQYHLGITGGVGIYRILTDNWNLDLNIVVHKFWTEDAFDDWVAVYSEGDQDPLFYQITVGVSVDIR